MIKKVVGINLNLMEESDEIIDGIARDVAAKLNDSLPVEIECSFMDFADVLELVRDEGIEFDDETVLVLGAPAYRNRIPLPCLRLLQRLTGKGTMTIAVVTYDSSYGRALNEFCGFIKAQGFSVVGAATFIAKNIDRAILRSIIARRPDERDFELIKVFGTATSNKIKRLAGSEVELLRVKPAPISIAFNKKPMHISAVRVVVRKEPEWFL